uniref:Uncharacterized protein n=1 Tax=Oryza punctata TaxID=4537 RepID=A0A0E0MCK7_ORYPU
MKEIGDQAIFPGNTYSKAVPTLPDHGSSIFFLGSNVTDYCLDGIIDGIGDCAYGNSHVKSSFDQTHRRVMRYFIQVFESAQEKNNKLSKFTGGKILYVQMDINALGLSY